MQIMNSENKISQKGLKGSFGHSNREKQKTVSESIAPWVRVLIMLSGVIILALLSFFLTGSFFPADYRQALVFQNALLFIVIGSSLLEHHYTKPADSVVNSLMGFITLLSVYGTAPRGPWLLIAGYCVIVFILSVSCVAASSGLEISGWKKMVADFTYRPSIIFGRSRLLFTILFLSGLWFFFSIQDEITLALIIFWGIFLAIWPLRIPQLVTAWFDGKHSFPTSIGRIFRIDNPNILRIVLAGDTVWAPSAPKVCMLPSGESYWVQPLFSQFQEGCLMATGLLTNIKAQVTLGQKNCVADPAAGEKIPTALEINKALGGGEDAQLVGFVVERSGIGAIRFETLNCRSCHEGMLIWAQVVGDRVYYQVVSGETQEESFAADKYGFQVATAVQLGIFKPESGFIRHDWLPAMNTPVFAASIGKPVSLAAVSDGDFELGVIPKSQIKVGGDFVAGFNSHTAILGVTGSGKTELAFDLIRHALANDVKVICIDLTAQYKGRLSDMNPLDMSLEEKTAADLGQKLFEVETGAYGGGKEKKVLKDFDKNLRDQISKTIETFLSDRSSSNLGLIGLEEISNTKATLWITELYMTCLLRYARENIGKCPRTLIVVEEAHTVMPESKTMGLGDFDSKGLVGKIAQVALQGRKYGMGLLVLAQRTATVSKTVLTQCNTIISFTCYDDTSLGFLRNIYGPEHIDLIPNLPRLHAIAFGNWVRSQQPIVFEVPFKSELGEPIGVYH